MIKSFAKYIPYIIQEYKNGRSSIDLAEEFYTYPNRIRRILIKHGLKLRSRNEAQNLAIQFGKSRIYKTGHKYHPKLKSNKNLQQQENQENKEEKEREEDLLNYIKYMEKNK